MRLRPSRSRALLSALLVAVVAACSPATGGSPSPAATARRELHVYAAASLRTVLEQLEAAYGSAVPAVTLTVSTDGSSALATKIEQGAPADVFLSADTANPRRLVEGGLASGDVVPFATNRLTVIVPVANPAGIGSPADLGRPGVKVVACIDGVPIRQYTERWLDAIRTRPGYGADFPRRYEANVVSLEENVGAIVAKVGLGEGDAGVVYVTDATGVDTVRMVPIPPDENVTASYGGVVLKAAADPGSAAAFLAWLTGPAGQAILASSGFGAPAP